MKKRKGNVAGGSKSRKAEHPKPVAPSASEVYLRAAERVLTAGADGIYDISINHFTMPLVYREGGPPFNMWRLKHLSLYLCFMSEIAKDQERRGA